MAFSLTLEDTRVAVIGLGYVGLPLAAALGTRYPVVGYDLQARRIEELSRGVDITNEIETSELAAAKLLTFSNDPEDLKKCNVFIVAVPTPVDSTQRPNLAPLISASRTVGKAISTGAVVVYESTVYPGATEEDCLPVVEEVSGLLFNVDFFAGYSPERINPGDKDRPLRKITKVTSGSTPEVAEFVDSLYSEIIEAGTYRASSIRVAEASKIIENTQRDVNIALINELSIVFSHMGIDTNEVLDAAATKWNFIRLKPGLVGGHCIGVDPYYLVHKSMSVGYIPDIIRSAREINDGMARHATSRLVKAMIKRDIPIKGAKVLVVGVTFKENCQDTRNTKAIDLIGNVRDYGMEVEVLDTWADPKEVSEEYGIQIRSNLPIGERYQAVILAVPHRDIVECGPNKFRELLVPGGIFFDMKAAFSVKDSDLRL